MFATGERLTGANITSDFRDRDTRGLVSAQVTISRSEP
jgi:hypothetical protein